MAKEDKKEEVIEVIASVIVPEKTQSFKVKKEFTYDKLYKVGNFIELSDKKTIEKLTSNKFI